MMAYHFDDFAGYVQKPETQKLAMREMRAIRDVLDKAGAIRADKIMALQSSGDSWEMLARVDWLVAIGELRVVYAGSDGHEAMRQHWIYDGGAA